CFATGDSPFSWRDMRDLRPCIRRGSGYTCSHRNEGRRRRFPTQRRRLCLPASVAKDPGLHPWVRHLNYEAQMASTKSERLSARRTALRQKFWPTVTDDDLWLGAHRDGFATVPRALPIILMIMDGMTKGSPVSSVYTDLWCRAPDEMFIQLQSHSGLAFSAGYGSG